MGDRKTDSAGFRRGSSGPTGFAVSSLASSRATGMDQIRVAAHRDWPHGEVLFAHALGSDSIGEGVGKLEPFVSRNQFGDPGGLRCANWTKSVYGSVPCSTAVTSTASLKTKSDFIWINSWKKTLPREWLRRRHGGRRYAVWGVLPSFRRSAVICGK